MGLNLPWDQSFKESLGFTGFGVLNISSVYKLPLTVLPKMTPKVAFEMLF
jgi:hypothetical protein